MTSTDRQLQILITVSAAALRRRHLVLILAFLVSFHRRSAPVFVSRDETRPIFIFIFRLARRNLYLYIFLGCVDIAQRSEASAQDLSVQKAYGLMVAHGGNRCIGANGLHTLQAMLVGLSSCCRRNSSQSDQTGKSFLLQLQTRHFQHLGAHVPQS